MLFGRELLLEVVEKALELVVDAPHVDVRMLEELVDEQRLLAGRPLGVYHALELEEPELGRVGQVVPTLAHARRSLQIGIAQMREHAEHHVVGQVSYAWRASFL